MSRTLRCCKDRASNTEEEDDDESSSFRVVGTTSTTSSAAGGPWNATRSTKQRLRQFSSEFLVDSSLLSSLSVESGPKATATVHDLTKAKLLAYYAGRSGGAANERRERANSFTDTSEPEPGPRMRRSGSLRAARTQRVYSDPPARQGIADAPENTQSARQRAAQQPRSQSVVGAPVLGVPVVRAPAAAHAVLAGAA